MWHHPRFVDWPDLISKGHCWACKCGATCRDGCEGQDACPAICPRVSRQHEIQAEIEYERLRSHRQPLLPDQYDPLQAVGELLFASLMIFLFLGGFYGLVMLLIGAIE